MEKFKKGDWIVITHSKRNWSEIGMTPLVGEVVQITSTQNGENTDFKGGESYCWNFREGHFRKALPEEIPGYIATPQYEIY